MDCSNDPQHLSAQVLEKSKSLNDWENFNSQIVATEKWTGK
jgi:hypothetical protein